MLRLCLLLGLTVCLSACEPTTTHTEAYVFGTLVDIQIDAVPTATAKQATNAVLARYQTLHQQLHAWAPSELTQLNAAIAKGQTPFAASPLLTQALQHAQQLSLGSHGLFNPAIGQLVGVWGFHQDQFAAQPIDHARIQQLLAANPSMQALHFSAAGIHVNNPAVQIDLGGYAKGLALDEGAKLLRAMGIQHALINIGGNVLALGQHHGRPWRVGIQHPRLPGAMAALDLDDGWAIGTSGDYQRFYLQGGQRYCHMIDPRTGAPATASQAATVLIAPQAHTGVLSDVASKPLFIDPAHASQYAKALGVHAWLVVYAQGKLRLNTAMQQKITWLQPKPSVQVLP